DQVRCFGPTNSLELGLRNPRQLFMDSHQVISLASGFGELLFQKLVKRRQVVQPPILSGTHLTQVAAEFYESHIPLLIRILLPCQNLIDLRENDKSPAPIEL